MNGKLKNYEMVRLRGCTFVSTSYVGVKRRVPGYQDPQRDNGEIAENL